MCVTNETTPPAHAVPRVAKTYVNTSFRLFQAVRFANAGVIDPDLAVPGRVQVRCCVHLSQKLNTTWSWPTPPPPQPHPHPLHPLHPPLHQ